MKKGLCLFYDEKFLLGRKCKAKRHLYSMELEEGEVMDDLEKWMTEEEAIDGPVE